MKTVKEKPEENVQEWIQTDDNQWVRKEDKHQYWVIDVFKGPLLNAKRKVIGTAYFVKSVEVNLNNLTIAQIEEEISAYYSNGLDEIIKTYKDEWKQIVAECIAENEQYDYDRAYLKNQKKLDKHIKRLYGIERTY